MSDERDQIIDSLLRRMDALEGRVENIEYALGMNPHGSQRLESETVHRLEDRLLELETKWLG